MKGYKVFNPDWTCSGYQFEVGKTFFLNMELWMGFYPLTIHLRAVWWVWLVLGIFRPVFTTYLVLVDPI